MMRRNSCASSLFTLHLAAILFLLTDHVANGQLRNNQLINQMIEQLRSRPPSQRSPSPSFSNSQRNFDVIGTGSLPLQGPAVDRPGRAVKDFSAANAAALTSRTGPSSPPSIEDVITGSLSRYENSALRKEDVEVIDDVMQSSPSLPFLAESSADDDDESDNVEDDAAEAKSVRRKKKPPKVAAADWPHYPEEPFILTPPVKGGAQNERPRKQKRPRKPLGGIFSDKFAGPGPAPHPERPPLFDQRRPPPQLLDERNLPRRQGLLDGLLSPAKNGPRPPPPPTSLLAPGGGPAENSFGGSGPFRGNGLPPNGFLNRAHNAPAGGPSPPPPRPAPQFLGTAPQPPPPHTDFRGPPRGNEGPPPPLRPDGRPAFLPQPIPRPGQEQRPPPPLFGPPPPSLVKGKPLKKGAKRNKPGADKPRPGFQPPETIYHGFEPSFQGN
jgi:hypothetical protein